MCKFRWTGFLDRQWFPDAISVMEQCREELRVIADYRTSLAARGGATTTV